MSLAVASWGMDKGSKRAFRPDMSLMSGEISGLGCKVLMMTATALPRTIRMLKSQLPEISVWKDIIRAPLRSNVVMVVPMPEHLSSKVEVLLAPFITDMKKNKTTYLILVRGKLPLRIVIFLLPSIKVLNLCFFCKELIKGREFIYIS